MVHVLLSFVYLLHMYVYSMRIHDICIYIILYIYIYNVFQNVRRLQQGYDGFYTILYIYMI